MMPETLDFRPHRCLPGGHLQTLAGFYLPQPRLPYHATPIPVDLEDGDQVVLHDDRPRAWQRGDAVTLLIHGLAGCHGSPYMVRIAHRLVEKGVRTFRMDLRGCGAAQGKGVGPGHAGRYGDALAALEVVRGRCPGSPQTIVGFSMGGNIALGALARASELAGELRRGIAVAPPVDLARCCLELQQGLSAWYDRYLVRRLIGNWRRYGGALPQALPRCIYEFDDRITAPHSGYGSAEEYYADASSGPRLKDIRIPTRILAAQDDPVVTSAAVEAATRSDSVELYLTRSGGHLGFVGQPTQAPGGRWLDQTIVDWVTGRWCGTPVAAAP